MPSVASTIVALVPLMLLKSFFPISTIAVLLFVILSAMWTVIAILICGLRREEKKMVATIFNKILN